VHEIITAPMRVVGVRLVGAETIISEVQRELRGADDQMPLLALALRSFWETRAPSSEDRTKTVLTLEQWRALGGVAGALAVHAHRVLDAFDPDAREIAIEAMLRLAAINRKPIRWNEAELSAVVASDAAKGVAVFDVLEREAILRRRDGQIQLSHPSLATLSRVEEARLKQTDRLVLLERLREAAIAWDRAGCHPEFLLTGSFYDDVMRRPEWIRRSISALEKQFVEASRRIARRRQVLRTAVVLCSMAAVVAIFIAQRAMEKREALAERARATAAEQAYISDVISRSRIAEDPYIRTAYLVDAIDRGAADPALPLELFRTASNLPRATFLTLVPSTSPSFPWNDRWLLANAGGTGIVVVDFHFDPFYQEPQADGGAPGEPPSTELHPHTTFVRPHEAPFVEKVNFAFDTAFATRSVAGEVRAFRLRPDGSVALAAILPARCTGALKLADAAPVLVCLGDSGLIRWDLRRADTVDTHPFQGLPLDVSPDGEWIAASIDRKVLLWRPSEKKTFEIKAMGPVELGRFGPRENMLALVEPGRFEIFDPVRLDAPLITSDSVGAPTFVRWDEGGLDLAICGASIGDESITGEFHYLRKGPRAPGDAMPKGKPCEPAPREGRPVAATSKEDVRDLASLPLGSRDILGGFRFAGGQFVTRDLVLLDSSRPAADSFLRFRGEAASEMPDAPSVAVAAVQRENDEIVVFQVNDEMRFYRIHSGKRELTRKGKLLRRCNDNRLAAWERDDKAWRVFDARSGATMATIAREPGFVLGVDKACKNFYFQRASGELVVAHFESDATAHRVIAQADGYVYDVRPSAARGAEGPGLWMALSSGALARVDENTSTVRVMGYASPRASALSDGPLPGELVYADATGVVLLGPTSAVRLLEPRGATVWEDISVAPNGSSMLLLSIDRIAAVDLGRREIVGSIPLRGRTRFLPWDEHGSVLVWSFDVAGDASVDIIPHGKAVTNEISRALCNLRVDQGRLKLLD